MIYLVYALLLKKLLTGRDEGVGWQLLFNNRVILFFWLGVPLMVADIICQLIWPNLLILTVEFHILLKIFGIIFFPVATKVPFWGQKLLLPAGAIANLTVMTANGFCMPVDKGLAASIDITVLSAMYCWIDESTNLLFLSDRIRHSAVCFFGVASVGDMMIFFGTIITAIQIFYVLRGRRKMPASLRGGFLLSGQT